MLFSTFIKEFSASSRIKFYFKYYSSRFRLYVTHQVVVSKILEISILKTRFNLYKINIKH